MNEDKHATVALTADVVRAYVANNAVHSADLPGLIANIYATLSRLGDPPGPTAEAKQPAVAIRKSVTDDYLISLEDGRPYKSLKRHLKQLGMTPEQYRTKWGLKPDYPMVAASYARQRSELAKAIGLGRKRAPQVSAPQKKRTRKPA